MAGKYAQGGIVNAASRYELEGGEAVMPIAWFAIVRLFAAFWKPDPYWSESSAHDRREWERGMP